MRQKWVEIRRVLGSVLIVGAAVGLSAGCSDETGQSSSTSTPSSPDVAKVDPAPPATTPPPTPPASAPATDPSPASEAEKPVAATQEELIAGGRAAYNANCIACHGLDPSQDGVLGPAIAGASAELIEARVLRAEYPPGYVPKRPTRVMVALPHLEPRLAELTAYLNSID